MKNYLNKKSNLLMIDKIKRTFEGKISWEFQKAIKEFKFLNIKTKIILDQELFNVELIIGTRKIFISYPENYKGKFSEDYICDIFLRMSNCELAGIIEEEKKHLIFSSVLTELALEKYKQTLEYKMNSLYDPEFNQRFENKIIYDYFH